MNPHSCALRPIFFSSALLAGLAALRAANRRQIRETLEKPRSKAQLFKRFCAKGDACALRLLTPFFSLLAGLRGPLGRKPPADMGNARKAKGAKLQLFGRFCAWGMRRSFSPAWENRSPVWACTQKEPRACETRGRKRHGARLARRRRATCPAQPRR